MAQRSWVGGRHRRRVAWSHLLPSAWSFVRGHRRLLPLAVAVLVSLALLALPRPQQVPAGPLTLTSAWPEASIVDSPARLSDGAIFTPLYHLDAATTVGTAPTEDRKAVRLVQRGGEGAARELRRLPEPATPQFGGFTSSGNDLIWAEATVAANGRGETVIWKMDWRSGAAPVALTSDTGDVVFFNSQYDIVVADGVVHWVAAARTADPVTEVRSVPLAGGKVSVQRVTGTFALSVWPWLVSAGTGQNAPVQLRDIGSGRTLTVPSQPSELVTCAAAWCRVLVLAGDAGPARLDLMRPDGTDRRRVAGGQVSASVTDVAILDRFEVLSQAGRDGSPTSSQVLMLYDLAKRRTVTVDTGVGMVLCRGGVLWWSTGDNEALAWHAVDLRTLT